MSGDLSGDIAKFSHGVELDRARRRLSEDIPLGNAKHLVNRGKAAQHKANVEDILASGLSDSEMLAAV